jgi:hypothetical protein
MKKIFLFFVLTTASSLLTAQNIPSYVPTDSLVGWWPFNGNANDESGNGNNGTVNGATLIVDRDSNSSSAYYFDGNDHIYVPYFPELNFGQGSFTLSLWAYRSGTSTFQHLLTRGIFTSSPYSQKTYFLRYHNNSIVGFHGDQNAINFSVSVNLSNPQDWHHFVLVYDSAQASCAMFIDGTMSSTIAQVNGNNLDNAGDMYFGCEHPSISLPSGPQFLTGSIDDIGIWNRALASQEIYELFQSCQDSIHSEPISGTFYTVPGSAFFTTEHTDTSATYQWQQNSGTGWTNLSDFGIYSGTTTDSLVLTGITSSMNGYGYRCIIDACSMDTTDVAFLTVENNIGLEEFHESIVVSPNPTSGALSINLTSAADYTLYNVAGQAVAQGKTDGILDITPLPAGSYQLVLTTEGRTSKHSVQKL